MVAEPPFTVVTSPAELTVATASSLLDHVKVFPEIAWPLASSA
jgi:hypothetical protein